MKMLILTSIFAPFYGKRVSAELMIMSVFLCFPLLWSSWDLPEAFSVGVMTDKLSSILMTLSLWTSILMVLLKSKDKYLNLTILLLLWSLLIFFSTSSLLTFFVFFEASLIPTLYLIVGWGYQPERLEAGYYFIFYTIFLSLPLLVSLIWLSSVSGNKYFYFDNLHEVCQGVLGFLILSVFLVKLPLFMAHLWLPKAHVEAPVVGSMILAGVLLKTGGYGVMRVFLYMQKTLVSTGFLSLSLMGMVYVCLVCLYSTDLKQMIAFSSVSHMNFMITGLMNNSQVPYTGSVIMMVSHGLCSSLMFMLADFSYSRCNSRSILVNKGLLMVVPSLSLVWSVAVMFNMGVPPTAGSISELLIITGSWNFGMYKVMFGLYLFFSAFYSIYLYMSINHGSLSFSTYSMEVKEIFAGVSHLVPLAGLTLSLKLLLY